MHLNLRDLAGFLKPHKRERLACVGRFPQTLALRGRNATNWCLAGATMCNDVQRDYITGGAAKKSA